MKLSVLSNKICLFVYPNNNILIMKHISYILLIFLLSICVDASAQSYEKMWRNITELQKKDLPQSVVNQSLAIFEKAKREKNCSQMIKSYLTAMQYREEISPDSLKGDIASLEKWVCETQKPEDRAVLYTILGSIVSGTDAPKALKYIQMSMQDASNLVNYSTSAYKPIIDKGDISERYFKNSLLNLIGRENLTTVDRMNNVSTEKKKILPETVSTIASFENYNIVSTSDNDYTSQYLKIYQTLLREYKNKGMMDAWIITSADILNRMMDYSKKYDDTKAVANLEKLINDYPKNEATAYVYSLLIDRKYGEMKYVQTLDLIKECRAKYAKSPLTKGLTNIEKEILRPSFSATIDDIFAGVENKIKVSYKNVTSFKTSLYSVVPSITALQLYNDRSLYDKVKSNATLINSQKHELKAYSDYNYHDSDIAIKINTPGIYYLEMETEKGVKDGKIIFATSIIPIVQTIPGNRIKIIAVDALNGKPIENADFNIYTYSDNGRNYQLDNTIKGDAKGVIFIDSAIKIGKYNITTHSDNGMELRNINSRSYRSYTDYKKEKVSLFTDRSIYKPGQIVHFSGVAYTNSDDSTRVLPLKEYEVSLLDANHVIISNTNVTTDKWGSFNGSFTLPTSCLNGRFCIRVISCVTSFMVEEYKRPTFEVILNPIENSFALGDTAYVTGCAKTFFGLPLKNVSVKYNIKSREFGYFNGIGGDIVDEKIIKTDENGCFTIPVAINMGDDRKLRYWYRRYEVSVVVTDDSGESAEAMASIPCGSSSLILNAQGIKDIILKESNDSISCEVTNLAGTPVNSIVNLNLYRFVAGKKDSVLVLEKQVDSNTKFPLLWTNDMKSGEYRIVFKVVDDNNKEAEYTKTFILFSKNDTKAPVDTDSWTYSDDGPESVLSFGTSRSDVDVYFNIYTKGKTIESKIFNLSDSIITMNCNYKPEYGDGAEITIAFVKNGKLYTFSKEIVKPLPDKRLILKWESFRDKLQPGKNEVWKLKITHPDGKPASAQLVSTSNILFFHSSI